MKSYNHLFEKLVDYDNIERAVNRASLGKKDRKDVQEILSNRHKFICNLQETLINKALKPIKHNIIAFLDGSSKKQRLLIQPNFRYEQVLHHAIIQVLSDILNKGMYEFSCGSIPKRGAHYGKNHIKKFIKRNPKEVKYVLKLDIKHFFQSINTKILKAKFKKIIHDEKMLYVLDYVLDVNFGYLNGVKTPMGLPIGFYTSQWLANWLLQDLDHYIKEVLGAKCYVRYMDDMVIFGRNKKQLHKDFEAIKKYLENLDLTIKNNYQIFRFDYTDNDGNRRGRPLDFMGFKFYREKITLRKSIFLKTIRKARRIGLKESLTWYDASQFLSYMGWLKATDTFNAYLKYIKPCVNLAECRKTISIRQQIINRKAKNGIELQKG